MKSWVFVVISIIILGIILYPVSVNANDSIINKTTSESTKSKYKEKPLIITGKITKIVDGDTIYLKGYKIRLSLTDTPERYEKGYKEATLFTKKHCPVGSYITVNQDDKQPYDKFGRVLGKVYCDGKVLNAELLYNKHAIILTKYCKTSEFAKETWAKAYGCK